MSSSVLMPTLTCGDVLTGTVSLPQYSLADFLQSLLSCSIMASANLLVSKDDIVVVQMGF